MHDAEPMRIAERRADLADVLHRQLLRQRPLPVQQAAQVGAVEQIRDQVAGARGQRVRVMHAHDVLVVERRQRPHLAREAAPGELARGTTGVEHLEGVGSAEHDVFDSIDQARPSLA